MAGGSTMASFNGGRDLERALQPQKPRSWVHWAVQFRWILVIFVVLPISKGFDTITWFREKWSARKSVEKRRKEHIENVEKVKKRFMSRDPANDGLVCTARRPWMAVGMRNVDYKRAHHFKVDLSNLNQVLEINRVEKFARVEPLVNMGQITRMIVPMGLSLPVVAELDDLTVGGLINGYGIEGSSHIYGLFADNCIAYQILLADGNVVPAEKNNKHKDLFYAIPWSQGTLGLLVEVTIKLIEVGPYMKLTYRPVRGTLQEIAQAYNDSYCPGDGDQDNPEKVPDFVEGMVYSETEGVMMTGRYATREEAKRNGNTINSVGWWFKPWFYQHAQTALKRGEFVEYIPTRDYYHRHSRSLSWEGKLILPFADQFWFRYLLGWMMPPKVSFLKATQVDAIRNYYHERHVIQDMLVPSYRVGDALEFSDREFEVYPLRLCPHRLFKREMRTQINPELEFEYARRPGDTPGAQMYTDVGVYYAPRCVFKGEEFDGVAAVKKMEQWMIQNHCFQPQYAVSELNERDFWRMFDGSLYQECREKYAAVGTFMSVYYKCKKGSKTESEVAEEKAKVTARGRHADEGHARSLDGVLGPGDLEHGRFGSRVENVGEPEQIGMHRAQAANAISSMSREGEAASLMPPQFPKGCAIFTRAGIGLMIYLAFGIAIYAWKNDEFSGIGIERFSLVDALYFCVVTMCTVGYGDIVPVTPFAKLFSCLFVLVGLCFINALVDGMVTVALEKLEHFLLSAVEGSHYRTAKKYVLNAKHGNRMRIRMKVGLALGAPVVCIVIGTLVIMKLENLALLDAFYCTIMSITTVGYGDLTFKTYSGRLFAGVWLLFSTLAVARCIAYLAEARVDKRHRSIAKWVLQRELPVGDLVEADLDRDGCVSKAEFVVYKVREMGRIQSHEIADIGYQFDQLDVNNAGKISLARLREGN